MLPLYPVGLSCDMIILIADSCGGGFKITGKRGFFNLDVTHDQAVDQLTAANPETVARGALAAFDRAGSCFNLPFLNRGYRVTFPGGKIYSEDGAEASLYLSIIILHYLVTADGTPLSGEWVSFRRLPGGDIYMVPFQRRAVEPFLKTFGGRPAAFTRAAASLGGYYGPTGTQSMIIPVLPRVPLNFILRPGDDEFPSSANILFDARASSYLPTEDYAHLPGVVTGELKALL